MATAMPKLSRKSLLNSSTFSSLQPYKIFQIWAPRGIGRPQPKLVVFGQRRIGLLWIREREHVRIRGWSVHVDTDRETGKV